MGAMTTDPRTLIADGRRHDEAMDEIVTDVGHRSDSAVWFMRASRPDNAIGIAWLRTNLRAMLDGFSKALDEVENLRKDGERMACELAELRRLRDGVRALHVDAERWLTEPDDRANLRAAEHRLYDLCGKP